MLTAKNQNKYYLQINCSHGECSQGFILLIYEQARYTHYSQCQNTLNASRAEGKDRKGPHYGHIGCPFVGFFALLLEPWDLFILVYLGALSLSVVHRIFSCSLWTLGLPWWLSWSRICLQCRRPGFNSWVGKISWRREQLPTPVFWPRESQGLHSPRGCKELDVQRVNSWRWHARSRSLTRDRIWAPCFGNSEFLPQDHQGSPWPPGLRFRKTWSPREHCSEVVSWPFQSRSNPPTEYSAM